jgi:hypothetical protein
MAAQQSDANRWSIVISLIERTFYPQPDPADLQGAVGDIMAPAEPQRLAQFDDCLGRPDHARREREPARAHHSVTRRRAVAMWLCAVEVGSAPDFRAAVTALLSRLSPHASLHELEELQRHDEEGSAPTGSAPTAELREGVLVLRVPGFDYITAERIGALLDSTDAGAWRATLIDLRGNGGGLLDAVTATADLFLDAGPLFAMRGAEPTDLQRFRSMAGDASDGRPLLLLVDGGTENGGEMLAAALGDRGRARIAGTPTSGAVIIRSVQIINPDLAMILPSHRIERNDGTTLTGPLTPDVTLTGEGDPPLTAAIALMGAEAD